MLLGEFEKAWRESDRVAARGRPDPNRFWDGLPFKGNRVLIRCLHGFGDAIQFIRYARLIRSDAARVTVQTHPELVSLFQGTDFIDEVITWNESASWDQHVEVMELPGAFRTTVDTVPNGVPYLRVPPDRLAGSRVRGCGGKLRVGLQWGASEWNLGRSIPFSELRPILNFEAIDYYSFQRGAARAEWTGLEWIHDIAGDSPEIVEAAADLMNMDVLITVDTMLAHLAGALGRDVWLLLPYEADWRWMLHRRDSPWYPTMRLFRQPCPGDWRSPVREMAAELAGCI